MPRLPTKPEQEKELQRSDAEWVASFKQGQRLDEALRKASAPAANDSPSDKPRAR